MATRETQGLIVKTSIALFNEHGTKAISTNKIADECQLSRGNLHYHFRTKEEIIQSIFQQISKQMDRSWYDDHNTPTMQHMYYMFTRQIKMMWEYRFFYRELNSLLQNDAHLKLLYVANKNKRWKELVYFFQELINNDLMTVSSESISLDSLLTASWLITDQWIAHLDLNDYQVNEENIAKGFELIVQIFDPYFSDKARNQYQQMTAMVN